MKHQQLWPALILLALLLPACGILDWGTGRTGYFADYDSNGERIYLTGTSADGSIDFTGGDFGGMMGGQSMMGNDQLACVDCHGAQGQGDGTFMPMAEIDAPDIRWSSLTEAEADEHGDEAGHEDEHGMEHPPYDQESFKRAVTQGLDPGGDPLDPLMPRWQMSDQALNDLITYLKRLG
jgi:hypothetical protein